MAVTLFGCQLPSTCQTSNRGSEAPVPFAACRQVGPVHNKAATSFKTNRPKLGHRAGDSNTALSLATPNRNRKAVFGFSRLLETDWQSTAGEGDCLFPIPFPARVSQAVAAPHLRSPSRPAIGRFARPVLQPHLA